MSSKFHNSFQCCILSELQLDSAAVDQSTMHCSLFKIATSLLLLAAVRSSGVQPKKLVYVDEGNGTLDPSCWENGPRDSPCENIGVALDGAELNNSTIVIVKQKCKNVPMADAPDGTPCPTWFLSDPSATGTCRCGSDIHGAVSCNDFTKDVGILINYCMTYSESTGPVVGACFYNIYTLEGTLYHPLPSNVMEVDMCEYYNRAGQL